MYRTKVSRGFSLVEMLVSIAVFVLISMAIYQGYASVMQVVRLGRAKILATALANEQLEIIRNLPYASVGLQSGIPAGILPRTQVLTRDGVTFYATTTIRYVDDPFDGTATSTPTDTSPADYKLVAIDLGCPNCQRFTPMQFTTNVVPKSLETSSSNGALFVKAFDANGQPVSNAQVHIQNNATIPVTAIDDVTDSAGLLQIIDAPTSTESYQITVTKPGYSTEKTYTPGAAGNPNPSKPHATVVQGQVTQTSFAVDKLSSLRVLSLDALCAPVSSVVFSLTGSKTIGSSPTVLKFNNQVYTTDTTGFISIPSLEWDTYSLSIATTTRYLAGITPVFPLAIAPNSSNLVQLITVPKNPGALLLTVEDAGNNLPLSNASVQITSGGYTNTLTTGQGFKQQTDWSGGSGQDAFSDATKYFGSDGNVVTTGPAGTISLAKVFGNYVTDGNLVSSTFDLGTSSSFYQLSWQPGSQPAAAGTNAVRFQIATNNDNSTWNFTGPDGTSASYYTAPGQSIAVSNNGNQYIRYKVFLHTDDVTVTPTISDVSFTFSTLCAPPGQVYFDGLASGTYSVLVQKSGYQNLSSSIGVSGTSHTTATLLMSQ